MLGMNTGSIKDERNKTFRKKKKLCYQLFVLTWVLMPILTINS